MSPEDLRQMQELQREASGVSKGRPTSYLPAAPAASIFLHGSQVFWAVCDQNWVVKSKSESLSNLTVDNLLALRRFISYRGTPSEILSDQEINFQGAGQELREAFAAMEPQLKERLANQQIKFKLNASGAPHFCSAWEREIQSVQKAGGDCCSASPKRCAVESFSRDRMHF